MLASDQGRRTVIKNLQDIVNDIQASKFTVSFSEIRYVKLNSMSYMKIS
jgi:hypothetical protein